MGTQGITLCLLFGILPDAGDIAYPVGFHYRRGDLKCGAQRLRTEQTGLDAPEGVRYVLSGKEAASGGVKSAEKGEEARPLPLFQWL